MRGRGSRLSGSAFCYRYTIVLRTSAPRLAPPPWPDCSTAVRFRVLGAFARPLVQKNPARPGLSRPSTSSSQPNSVRGKTWVAGTGPATGSSVGRGSFIFQPRRVILLQICCRCSHRQQSVQLTIAGTSGHAGAGKRAIQWRAMSSRRQIHTRGWPRMYWMKRISAVARPG